MTIDQARRQFEISYFRELLEKHAGKVYEVARAAGITASACYTALDRLGLRPINVKEEK